MELKIGLILILFSMSLSSLAINSPGESVALFKSKINEAAEICQMVSREAGQISSACPVQF